VIDTVPFPFSPDFQNKVLSLMLRDKSFIAKKRHILSHKYFENPAYVKVSNVMLDFYDKYGTAPTEDSLLQLLSTEEDYKLYKIVLKKMNDADLSDASYVIDAVTDFCTQQALRIALYVSEEHLKNKEYDKILPLIEKAMLSKDNTRMSGLKLSESVDSIKEYLSEEARSHYKIASLIHGMDKILNGGAGPGELHMIFAPTKKGKSILLNNLAYACALQGKKATYISLEMSEQQIATRTHMRLSGLKDTDLLKNNTRWQRSFNRLMSRGGNVYFKRFPMRSLTLKSLDKFIDDLWKIENYSTDLLIVDYLDIMKGDRHYESGWQDQGPLAEGLRSILCDKNIPGWTATQAGKHAGEKDQLSVGEMKGDSVKAEACDSLWSLLQNVDEENCEPPRGRLKNNLLREGHGMGTVIPLIFDKHTMLLTDLSLNGELPF
jgi:replicative DNA helicase